MTPRIRPRRRALVLAAAVVVAAGLLATGAALNRARVAFEERHAQSYGVGDCVVVPSSAPHTLRAVKASCATDPSYTIGATTAASGSCPSAEYQRFPTPAADEPTATLCLVPNLVAEHCYRLEMPVGMVSRADCAATTSDAGTGVLVQVTQRLDIHDQRACPESGSQFAWPYPSPARTYCTLTRS